MDHTWSWYLPTVGNSLQMNPEPGPRNRSYHYWNWLKVLDQPLCHRTLLPNCGWKW